MKPALLICCLAFQMYLACTAHQCRFHTSGTQGNSTQGNGLNQWCIMLWACSCHNMGACQPCVCVC